MTCSTSLPLNRLPHVGDLAVLVALAEHGGVGAAARALGMAQPNATRSLRRLERDLRLQLVHRDTRGSTLTEHGGLVVDWARIVLEANRRLLAGVQALADDSPGQLQVAASQTIAEDLLPRWLAALSLEQPEVGTTLTVGNSSEVGRLVSRGALGFIESPDLPSSIAVEVDSVVVATDRLVVVVAPGHEWARRTRPVGLDELAATRLVVRERGSGTRVTFEQATRGLGLAPPRMELASNAAVRVAVASGVGPAVLSEHAVQAAVAAGELRAVMVDGLLVERPLRAVWARERDLGTAGRRLVELATAIEAQRGPGVAT
ncbi:MAG: LysR family transcriptional regulator [Actinomycetales bacterium]